MKLLLVAVHDRAVDAYNRPFAVNTTGQAIRSFGDEVNNPQSPMNAHADDYALFELGTFDEQTGRITGHDIPIQLSLAKQLKTT